MTLSKMLLLALTGTGVVAPMAASANEMASLTGNAAINEYMQQQDVDRFRAWESKNQVTSVNQFSDVLPTDWAYQALSNLVEKYGCVAGYPNGKFKGGNAMTRYEAAALLNACLDRISEVTDELQKLLNEFDAELTVLTSRVDGLESKVGQLQAQQFSSTTRLRGEVSMIIGGTPNYNRNVSGVYQKGGTAPNRTAFNYDARLSFDTSFSGKDLLRTRLRSGNFSSAPFGSSSQIFKLDKAETQGSGTNAVWIDRLFYTFPVGDEIKLTAGAIVRNTEILSFIPSAYRADILDFFNLAGASSVYNKATGAGFGFNWKQKVAKGKPYLVFDANYVSENRYNESTVGAFDASGGLNVLAQLGLRGTNYGAAVAYRYGSEGSKFRDPNFSTSATILEGGSSNGVSIAGFWQPLDSKWVPSISLGYSFTSVDTGSRRNQGNSISSTTVPGNLDVQSWMVGFQWSDVFMPGNSAGFAFGQAPFTTDQIGSNAAGSRNQNKSNSYLWELFYKYQVTDNISITPSVFYSTGYQQNNYFATFGGVIQTTFRF
jgi:hypothetical protein